MKKYPIIIDSEFGVLVPPMSADSLAQLEANIREHGLREKLTLWRHLRDEYILIDGHHRFEILKRLVKEEDSRFCGEDLSYHNGTKDIYSVIELLDHDAVKLWILENQIGRRNLTKQQRIEMVAKIVVMRQEQSAAASRANLWQGGKTPDVTETVPSGKRTVAAAAKEFDVPREPLQAAVNEAKGKPKITPRPPRPTQQEDGFENLFTPAPNDAAPAQSLSETFYVIRRKSDECFFRIYNYETAALPTTRPLPKRFHVGAFYADPLHEVTSWQMQEPDLVLYSGLQKVQEVPREAWEWVKVEATYRLTAEEAAVKAA